MNHASPRWVLTTACLGYAMVIIDTTAVNVALPAIGARLGGSLTGLQWTVDGYVLVFAALLILGGSLGDRFGSARLFRIGIAVFALASAACALAPDVDALIAFRLLQGAGAALLAPACLALIAQAYAFDAAARARATALFVTAAGSPQAFGPLLGGGLVQLLGWRAIFWINVPIALATSALATRLGDPPPAPERRPLPLPGHLAVFVTIAALTAVIIEAPKLGLAHPVVWLAIAAALLAAVALARHERRAPEPAISRKLLASAAGRYIGVGLLLFASYYGLNFVLTLYLQQHLGFDAFGTGLVVLAAALPIFALPLVSSGLVRRFGARRILRVGLLSLLLGAVSFAAGAATQAEAREGALALLGIGMGLAVTPQISLVMEASPDAVVSQASGVLNAGRQLGTVLGVAVLGSLAAEPTSPAWGVAVAALAAAVIAGVAAGVMAVGATRPSVARRTRSAT